MDIDIKQRVLEVMQQGLLMSLGTADANGVWVAVVHCISDESLNIYWMSSPKTRHSQAVEQSGKAAGTITITAVGKEPNFGIQFEGTAQKIESLDFEIAKQHVIKRGHPAPDPSTPILREGSAWYKLTPTTIFLIDEKNFGFKRQKIEL